jgi:uncharacterized RDD family membrane protein YckC
MAAVQTDAQDAELFRRPTTPRRFVAYLIDTVLLIVFGLVCRELAAQAGFGPRQWTGPEAIGHPATIVLQLVAVAVSAAYFVGCWCIAQRTVGMRLLGLRIEQADGESGLTPRQGVVRWLVLEGVPSMVSIIGGDNEIAYWVTTVANWVWWVVLVLTTVRDPQRRGIHDKLAGSLVIATR